MKIKNLTLLIALLGAVLFFEACDDDDGIATTDLSFSYKIGNQDFNLGEIYDINGVAVSFETANFYVSGISLLNNNGEDTPIDGKTLLITPDDNVQLLDELNRNLFTRIKFDIGVSPEDNDQTEEDFTTRSESDPLSLQSPTMHWNWNAGYKFFRIDGLVDVDGDGTPETAMEYHTGTNNLRQSLDIAFNDRNDGQIALELDIAQLFAGLDLTVDYSVHVGDNPTAAMAFTNNLVNAITAE